MADFDARYEPSTTGWRAIAMSPEILAACVAEAERGKAFAVGISPDSNDQRGKPYSDSFDVHPIVTHAFRRGPRVAALLANDAGHAAALEWGNEKVPRPHRILGRTAHYLGAR